MDLLQNKILAERESKVQEQAPDYEKAETNLLRDALRRSYKERFLVATRLYKIQQMLNKAIITHQP